MKRRIGLLIFAPTLALLTISIPATHKTNPDGSEGIAVGQPAADGSKLATVFMPPPLNVGRGVSIDTLQENAPPPSGVIQEQDRVPCGNDRVAVDIFRPAQPGHYPVVILLHGTHGPGRAEKFYMRAAEELAKNGFVSLFLRYYDRGRKGKGNRSLWTQTIEDCLTFAAKLSFADPERMALLGFSQGAFLALNDAPSDPRIRAVVAYYGGLSPGYVPQAKVNMPPTLLFHGTADGIVSVRRSVETLQWLRQEGRPADLVVYRGAGHGFLLNSNGGADEVAAQDSLFRTISFLNFHLRYPAWTPAVDPQAPAPQEEPKPAADGSSATQDPFAQPPLRVIPYLQESADSKEKSFTLVNPPADEVFHIASSAPLKRWHHSTSRSRTGHKAASPGAGAPAAARPSSSSSRKK